MDFTNFSLLYPSLESSRAHYSGKNVPNIDMFVLDELGMLDAIELHNRELAEFVTSDPEVIEYRMDTFRDMLENEICELPVENGKITCGIKGLRF